MFWTPPPSPPFSGRDVIMEGYKERGRRKERKGEEWKGKGGKRKEKEGRGKEKGGKGRKE